MSAVLKGGEREAPVLAAMREADLDEVIAIERAIYSHPWTRGNFGDSLRAGYACRTWRLGGRGGALAGYFVLMAAAGEAHLLNLSIAAGYQRSGHGSAPAARGGRGGGHARRAQPVLEVRRAPGGPGALPPLRLPQGRGTARLLPAYSGREDALVLTLPLA